MAALYGRLQGDRGEVTRMGSKNSGIESRLETWQGEIRTTLEADGSFVVRIGSKRGCGKVVARGNVDNGERFIELIEQGKYSARQAINDGAGVTARVDVR